jgi:hypothetical protein
MRLATQKMILIVQVVLKLSLSDKGEKDNFHFSRSSEPSVP